MFFQEFGNDRRSSIRRVLFSAVHRQNVAELAAFARTADDPGRQRCHIGEQGTVLRREHRLVQDHEIATARHSAAEQQGQRPVQRHGTGVQRPVLGRGLLGSRTQRMSLLCPLQTRRNLRRKLRPQSRVSLSSFTIIFLKVSIYVSMYSIPSY